MTAYGCNNHIYVCECEILSSLAQFYKVLVSVNKLIHKDFYFFYVCTVHF